MQVRSGDGRGEPYTLATLSGPWRGDDDTKIAIAQDSSGYTLTYRDNSVDRYDTTGKLISETSSVGLTTIYSYTSGKLSTVTGPFGHALAFGYNASDLVATVTDSAGQTVGYLYDTNSNLTRVDYPDTTAKLYHYENASFPNHLTGISYVDAAGVATRYATYAYDSTGKATLTQHAQTDNGAPQESFGLTYNSDTQTTVTDPVNTQEVMTFATNLGVKNLVNKVNQSDSKSVAQVFDARNNLTCRKDEENRITLYSYNSTNQKTSMTEGLSGSDCATCLSNPANCNAGGVGRVTTYEYLSPTLDLPRFIRRPSVATGQTFETELVYGDAGHPNLPTQVIQRGYTPAGVSVSRTVALGYNAYGQVNSINGPRTDVADITTLEYYECTTGGACGQLKKVTNALGQVTNFHSYDNNGRVLSLTDNHGIVWNYAYDRRGRVKQILAFPPGGAVRASYLAYDVDGQMSWMRLTDGQELTYDYDAARYLRAVTDSLGNRIEYAYDLKGNRRQSLTRDPDGALAHSIQTAYDLRNHVAWTQNGNVDYREFGFDALGNLLTETDPNGYITTHQYDALSRLLKTIDPVNGVGTPTSHAYNVQDLPTQVATPNGATTQYVYDDLGNLLQETSPDRGNTIYTHDAAGNVKIVTDGRGMKVTYSYDALNRPGFLDYPGVSSDATLTYDSCANGAGRLCGDGWTGYAYDPFGNVTQQTRYDAINYVTGFSYDAADRLTGITYPDGRPVGYTRDSAGRITGVTARVNGTTVTLLSNRSFRADGQVKTQTFGNGLAESRFYTAEGWLKQVSLGAVDNRLYTYHANGNPYSRQGSWQFALRLYDALDRLTYESVGGGGSVYNNFGYDANGNRQSGGGVTYLYAPASNRLTRIGVQDVILDGAGNVAYDPWRGASYSYNAAGRLFQAVVTGGALAQYDYDPAGRRMWKTVGGVTTLFHYDAGGRLLQETRPDGTLVRAYVWVDGTPVAQIDRHPQTGQEALVYLHTDALETPRLATDAQSRIVWRWEGGAFGETSPDEDVDGDGNRTVVNLRYAGMYADSETGLYYWGSRYYDPKIGRSITPDRMSVAQHVRRWRRNLGTPSQHPLEINPYVYVANNPLRWTDPTGFALCIDGTWELLEEITAPGALATFVCKCRFVCKTCDGRYTGITTDVLGTPTNPNWGKPNADWEQGKGGSGKPRPRPGDPTGCECETPEGATGCRTCSAYDAGPAPTIGGNR